MATSCLVRAFSSYVRVASTGNYLPPGISALSPSDYAALNSADKGTLWDDYTDVGALGNGTFVQVLNAGLLGWTQAQAFQVSSASRDGNGAITTASVVWPDGSTGTFTTDTASAAFPGAVDAYHVTYVPASGSTKTVTQAAVTRDSSTGAVTAQPALTVA